jgi:hypothetical protein
LGALWRYSCHCAGEGALGLKQRLLIGCLGALAPILVNLCVVDLQTVLPNLLPLEALSYVVRLLALCGSACLVVYLNSDEARPAKLFQLGVMAPAMLTSMLNGAAVANKNPSVAVSTPAAQHSWLLVSPANAQSSSAPQTADEVLDCTKPKDPTVSQQILKGLVGITPGNQWFVVVGSNPTVSEAVADVDTISQKYPGKYQLKICGPTGVPNAPYRVLIGQYLTYADATNLKNNAIAAGLPPDTWVWNPFATTQ